MIDFFHKKYQLLQKTEKTTDLMKHFDHLLKLRIIFSDLLCCCYQFPDLILRFIENIHTHTHAHLFLLWLYLSFDLFFCAFRLTRFISFCWIFFFCCLLKSNKQLHLTKYEIWMWLTRATKPKMMRNLFCKIPTLSVRTPRVYHLDKETEKKKRLYDNCFTNFKVTSIFFLFYLAHHCETKQTHRQLSHT